MAITKYKITQDKIDKLQSLKTKTKVKFHQNINNYYAEMNYRRQRRQRRQSNTF